MDRPCKPDSAALAEVARDFQCLIEPAFAQACCCDRYCGEPIRGDLAGDGPEEEPGESGDHAQVPIEFQSPDQVVDRRRICECTDGAVNWWMLHRAGAAPLRMAYRTCSADDAGLRQSRQFAGTGVAEIGDGPAHLVAEQADVAWYESHWMPPETLGRVCRVRPVRPACSSHSSREKSAICSRRTGVCEPILDGHGGATIHAVFDATAARSNCGPAHLRARGRRRPRVRAGHADRTRCSA